MIRYLLTFDNGKTVISEGISYIQAITWEQMMQSKIVKTEVIN